MISLLIYISGIVPSYLMHKKAFTIYNGGEWILIGRCFAIVVGSLSWFGFGVSLIQWAILKISEDDWTDKKVKW